MLKYILILGVGLSTSCCNITVNLIHTEGEATDLVDETDSASPNVETQVSVPLTML